MIVDEDFEKIESIEKIEKIEHKVKENWLVRWWKTLIYEEYKLSLIHI